MLKRKTSSDSVIIHNCICCELLGEIKCLLSDVDDVDEYPDTESSSEELEQSHSCATKQGKEEDSQEDE